jgi:hypothetical protein
MVMVMVVFQFSSNVYCQENNNIYIQYFEENNISYVQYDNGTISFNNKYTINTNMNNNKIIDDNIEIRYREINYFQITAVYMISNFIPNQNNVFGILNFINWIHSQTIMCKIFLAHENDQLMLFFSSEIILNDALDFKNYIRIMCNEIDNIIELFINNAGEFRLNLE